MSRAALFRTIVLSALSGCVWAVIAHFLAREIPGIEGGLYVSPLIGVILGLTFRSFPRHSFPVRAFLSLLGLYLAVAMFGVALGMTDLITGPTAGPGWHRKPVETVLQGIVGSVWGVTMMGWVVFLWPLAYVNFLIVEPRDRVGSVATPEVT